jgi:hypothetical protein
MLSRGQKTVVAATLHDVCHVSAIDLEVNSNVPSEVRHSVHDQESGGLSGRSSDRDNPNESTNQKESADVFSQAAHALIIARICPASRLE